MAFMKNNNMKRRAFLRGASAALALASVPGLAPAQGLEGPGDEPYTVLDSFEGCMLSGRAILKHGKPDIPAFHQVTADQAYCGRRIRNRTLLLGKGNTVKNVLVWLAKVPAGKPMTQEEIPVINDKKCDFYPKAMAVGRGQKVTFRNGDPIYNDFRAILNNSVLFNIAVPMRNQTFTKKMKKCGIVDLYCNVHPWEHAIILVVSHPYFCVTARDGSFKIDNVPAGKYELMAFHEALGFKSAAVTLSPQAPASVDVLY
jgi:plastocyanin